MDQTVLPSRGRKFAARGRKPRASRPRSPNQLHRPSLGRFINDEKHPLEPSTSPTDEKCQLIKTRNSSVESFIRWRKGRAIPMAQMGCCGRAAVPAHSSGGSEGKESRRCGSTALPNSWNDRSFRESRADRKHCCQGEIISDFRDRRDACPTQLLADAALAASDKLNQVLDLRQLRQFLFYFRQRVRNRESFAEQNFVSMAHGRLRFLRNPVAFHADFVDGARLRRIAVGNHERRHVLHDFEIGRASCREGG